MIKNACRLYLCEGVEDSSQIEREREREREYNILDLTLNINKECS